MQSGSLTIGDTALNYGGGDLWTTNTSGLLLECSSNTEIAVHDNATRLASCMYYQGDTINQLTIGRDMGYGAIKNVVICGFIVGNGSALTALNYNSIINSPDLSVYATNTNVNSLSSNSTLLINGHTTQLSNLNSTSTTIFNNLNSLSGQSFFL
jgi:hypothetical protein